MADRDPRPRRTRTVLAAALGGLLALGIGWFAVTESGRTRDPLPRNPALVAAAKATARFQEAAPATAVDSPEPKPAQAASDGAWTRVPAANAEVKSAPAGPAKEHITRWRGTLILKDSTTGMEVQGATSGVFETTVKREFVSGGRTVYPQGPGGRVRLYTDEPRARTFLVGMTAENEETAATPASTGDRGWVDIRVPGYAAKRVPHPEDGTEVEVLLDPWTVSVRGVLEVPGTEQASVQMLLRSLESHGEGLPRLGDPMKSPGPFEICDLPPGDYELVLQARTDSATTWARRRFEYRGAPVDLGAVVADGASGIRARKLDPDGLPLFDSYISVHLQRTNDIVLTSGPGKVLANALSVSAKPATGGDGWVELPGLLPGGRYRAASEEAAPVSAEAVAPAENGAFAEVTLARTTRPVHCTLRFTLRGKAPAYWEVVNSPFPDEGWKSPGLFEGDLLPGTYQVGLRLNGETKDPGAATWVGVEVPEGNPFDRTYDL